MEATTTRASTVIRSMPTRETRTHASITMPLSSTRSRTSMRLVPPVVLSTGIAHPPCRQRSDLALEQADLLAQLLVLGGKAILPGGQVVVVLPPVQPDFLRFVDRAHDQANPDGEQLDLGQRDLHVARHHQALVEDPVEDVDETAGALNLEVGSHWW